MVLLKYMVGYLEAAVAEARPLTLVHGEGALVARFENLHIDFDPTATPPVYNDTMAAFMKSVKGRSITAPLRFSFVPVGKALLKAGLPSAALPDVLARVAKYLPDRAHNIAFTKRVGSAEPVRVGSAFTGERFVTTPVAWKRVADATTIAALQVPGADGTKVDVFKSSVAVAREVGDFLARRL